MKPLFWIIDEEWANYQFETKFLMKKFPECTIRHSGYDYSSDLAEFGYKADIILAQVYASISKSTIDRLTKCCGIAIYGGGFDRVDIEAAGKRGIMVTNVQGYCAEDIADYVMAAIYRRNKSIDCYFADIHSGKWGAQAVNVLTHRIESSTLLIYGFGRIGRTVAKKALRSGMRVLAYDPNVDESAMRKLGIKKAALSTGLSEADYISVHVNLCESTQRLISKKDFEQMKPGAYFINTSRGAIIDENDLIEAVGSGRLSGAALDVITHEPPREDEKIFHCKNILVTPHISYISQESFRELKKRTLQNAVCMLSGREPADLVNKSTFLSHCPSAV